MSNRTTIAQIRDMLKGTHAEKLNGHLFQEDPPKKKPKGQDGAKTKGWIELNLQAWCGANGLTLEHEFRFYENRKWRADWCIKELKVLIEYEGLGFKKTGHTTSEGFTANTEKYNQATAMGYRLFRYTYLNYKSIINDLNKLIP